MSGSIDDGNMAETLADHEKRIRECEHYKTSHEAQIQAWWAEQRSLNHVLKVDIKGLNDRVGLLPNKDDMHEMTNRMNAFTAEAEDRYKQQLAAQRVSETVQQTILNELRDKKTTEMEQKRVAKLRRDIAIPILTTGVGALIVYVVTR